MAATSTKQARSKPTSDLGTVAYLNPPTLPHNPAFTQVVVASGPVNTIYIGAQMPVDSAGTLIGKGDIALQTEQVLENIGLCLAAAGAGPEHLVRWNIYVAPGQPIQAIQASVQTSMRWWGGRSNPPANSVMFVAGFPMLPDVLLMIDAIAVVPA